MTEVEQTASTAWVVRSQVTATHGTAWMVHAAIEGVMMVAGYASPGVRTLGAIWARGP